MKEDTTMKEVTIYIIEETKKEYTWKRAIFDMASLVIGAGALFWFVINIENLIW